MVEVERKGNDQQLLVLKTCRGGRVWMDCNDMGFLNNEFDARLPLCLLIQRVAKRCVAGNSVAGQLGALAMLTPLQYSHPFLRLPPRHMPAPIICRHTDILFSRANDCPSREGL